MLHKIVSSFSYTRNGISRCMTFGNRCFASWKNFFLERPLRAQSCSRCCESYSCSALQRVHDVSPVHCPHAGWYVLSIDTFYQTTTTTNDEDERTTQENVGNDKFLKKFQREREKRSLLCIYVNRF